MGAEKFLLSFSDADRLGIPARGVGMPIFNFNWGI